MKMFRFDQVAVGISGAINLVTGLALLFAPVWFFENIGHHPPFNRHYEGDVGAFVTALGLGLLLAARDPYRHRGLVGVAALGSALHAGNHLYDDLIGQASTARFFAETLPLLALALLLGLAYRILARTA